MSSKACMGVRQAQTQEICPVCKTVQLTYMVKGRPNDFYVVTHNHNGLKCEGSHKTR